MLAEERAERPEGVGAEGGAVVDGAAGGDEHVVVRRDLGRDSILSRTREDCRDTFQDVLSTDLNSILSLLNRKCLDRLEKGIFSQYCRDIFL